MKRIGVGAWSAEKHLQRTRKAAKCDILGAIAAGALVAGTGLSIYDLVSRPGAPEPPDISGELARIGALYEQQRQLAKASVMGQLAEANQASASDLAARGIYSSPVSEFTFGRNRAAAGRALAEALGTIGVGEAGARASILERLLGTSAQFQMLKAERAARARSALVGLLGGIGSAALMANYMKTPVPPAGNTNLSSSYFGLGGGYYGGPYYGSGAGTGLPAPTPTTMYVGPFK